MHAPARRLPGLADAGIFTAAPPSPPTRRRPTSMLAPREHRRSVAFLEREGESWACFLVTFQAEDGRWKGYFSFRPGSGDLPEDAVRTADIFLEDSEREIDEKARGLGRPLLSSLLASSLHLLERDVAETPRLRRWFRSVLSESSLRLSGSDPSEDGADADEAPPEGGADRGEPARLRSLYASYRMDQVAHLIALVDPADFERAVGELLDGRSIDFRGRDRLQLAMMVVEQIEELLPLPPFEVWVDDYLDNRESYRLYAHTLHRAGRLP